MVQEAKVGPLCLTKGCRQMTCVFEGLSTTVMIPWKYHPMDYRNDHELVLNVYVYEFVTAGLKC